MNTFIQLALTQIWQIVAVTLAVALVVRVGCRRRPHLAYLLWMIVIAKCLTPPVWSSPTSLFSWATMTRPAADLVISPTASPEDRTRPSDSSAFLALATEQQLASAPESKSAPTPALPATTVLGIIWLTGALTFAGFVIVNLTRVSRRLQRTALPLDTAWLDQLNECSRRLALRRHVRLIMTSEQLGPAVYGILRPVVVLPHCVAERLPPGALPPIIAHELVHIRRGDLIAALIQVFVQCVWWFHPFVWWANRQANRERERACDEEVVSQLKLDPGDYGQWLIDVLRMKQSLRPVFALPGVRAVEVTQRRLDHIMRPDSRFHSQTPRTCWAIALVAALVALPGAGLAFDSKPKAANAPPEAAANEATVIKRVLDHWRAREERSKSLHITWESKQHPRAELWMKGNAYRVEVAKFMDRGGFWQAFDGAATRFYEARDRTGEISAGSLGIGRFGPRLFPILFFARPFSQSGFDPSPAKWRLVGENAIINNLHCVKLATTRNGFDESLWVDPARDDFIVGWELLVGRSGSSTLVTIGYRRDEKHGWLPTRWTETQTWPQQTRSTEETIVGCSIDEPIPNEIFAPAFPPESTVLDTRTLERYRLSKTGAKVTIAKFDSPETLKIVKSLEQPVDFTIDPEPMKDAFEFIATRYQIKIVIDPAVARAGVDTAMEVQNDTPGIKLKDVIPALLKQAPNPLVYRVENGALTILPAPRTK
jgi:beta-lactamase regulating signal transducer with metallopeptidase domain